MYTGVIDSFARVNAQLWRIPVATDDAKDVNKKKNNNNLRKSDTSSPQSKCTEPGSVESEHAFMAGAGAPPNTQHSADASFPHSHAQLSGSYSIDGRNFSHAMSALHARLRRAPEELCTIFGCYFYTWVTPFVRLAANEQLEKDRIPPPQRQHQALYCGARLSEQFRRVEMGERRHRWRDLLEHVKPAAARTNESNGTNFTGRSTQGNKNNDGDSNNASHTADRSVKQSSKRQPMVCRVNPLALVTLRGEKSGLCGRLRWVGYVSCNVNDSGSQEPLFAGVEWMGDTQLPSYRAALLAQRPDPQSRNSPNRSLPEQSILDTITSSHSDVHEGEDEDEDDAMWEGIAHRGKVYGDQLFYQANDCEAPRCTCEPVKNIVFLSITDDTATSTSTIGIVNNNNDNPHNCSSTKAAITQLTPREAASKPPSPPSLQRALVVIFWRDFVVSVPPAIVNTLLHVSLPLLTQRYIAFLNTPRYTYTTSATDTHSFPCVPSNASNLTSMTANRSMWAQTNLSNVHGSIATHYAADTLPPCPPTLDATLTRTAFASVYEGVAIVVAFALVCLLRPLLDNKKTQRGERASALINSAVWSLVLEKSVTVAERARVHPSASSGRVLAIAGTDLSNMRDFAVNAIYLIIAPMELILFAFVYWYLVGWTATAVFAAMLIMVPVQAVLAQRQGHMQSSLSKWTDVRLRRVSELLSGIRVVKAMGWESKFVSAIETEARLPELHYRRLLQQTMTLFTIMVLQFAPLLVLGMMLLAYIMAGHVVTSELIFPLLMVIGMLFFPMAMLPAAVTMYIKFSVSARRVTRFLECDDEAEEGGGESARLGAQGVGWGQTGGQNADQETVRRWAQGTEHIKTASDGTGATMLPHAPDCNHTDGTATAGIVAASPATNATAATLSSIPVARDSVSSSITDRDTNNKNESRSDLGVVFDHATVLATVAVPLPASYTKYTMGALRRCRYGLQRCLLSSACLPCRPQRSSQVATQNQRTTGDEPACAALSPHKWRAMIAGGGGGGQVPIEMRWVRNSSTTTPSSSSSPSSSPTDSGPPLRTANDARNGKKAQKQQPSFGEASPDKSTDKPRMATWGRVALVTRPLLHDMTLRFPHGKLSVIFGATGSGKSVLLASLLAGHLSTVRAGDDGTKAAIGGADDEERDSESGATTAAGMRIDARTCTDATEPQISPVQLLLPPGSRLAYVPQVPWIMHASIKRNITLWNDEPHCDRTNGTMEDDGANDSTCYYQSGKNDGATVEDVDERMERAMACCQLTNDVRDLRDGVETEVGEKGINLSGGQKARLSLARAVYADCAVYLLDDPLSALDAHVGARVMQECVVQALSHTTRLLVTHQIHLALPSADYVVVMHEGRVVFAGEPQDYARSPWCERVETTKRQADAQRRRQMSTSAAHDGTTKREKDTNNNANKDQTKDWSGSESEESEMNLDEAMRTRTQSTIIPITHSNEGRSAQTSHTDQVRSCAADKKDANDTASHANTAAAVTHKSSSAGAMGRVATQPSKSLAGEADSGDEDGTDNDREESAESSEPSCVQMHTQLMEEEEKAMGHVPWHVYLRYAAAGAGVRLAPDSTSSSSSAAVSASGMCHPSDYSVAGSADASSETTESDRPDRGNTTSHAIAKVFSEDALTEQAGHDSPANNDNNNNNNKHKQNGDNGDTQATLPAPCYATFRALLYFFSIFFFFLLCEGLAACSSLWLTGWAVDFLPFLSAKYYLLVYVLMNLTECVMAFANSLLCYRFARHAGRTLHRDLLLTLASATIGFFDRTPQGRMVNRFSTDVNVMDNELPRNGMIVMRLICFFISTMALSIYGTPPVAAVFALAAVVFVILLRYYSRVIREVRRRGSVAQSPLFSLLEDVMSGRPTLRAYGVIHRVFDRALRDLDVVYSYKYLEHAVDHWMLLRLQYLGSVTMVTVCCVGFAEKYISSESDMSVVRVGLISLSLTMCNDMNWLLPAIVHLAAQSDANMNSVQRIVHYIDTVEQETLFLRSTLEEELQRKKQKDAETAGRRRVGSLALCGASSCCGSQSSVITKTAATSCAPHASILAHKEQHGQSSLDELAASPMTTFTTVTTTATTATTPANASVQAGSVQYIRVNMRYRPCLPLVLRRVSFAIHPGERIGVVGRTGSGKSTLLLTLLRLVDVCDGTILVCGQPIRHYTLPRLRQLFSFIPQDPLLFHGTVRSNLDPFGVYRSDVAIWEALEHVGMAAHFRENQPGKDKNSNNATATATNKHSVAVHALPSEHAEETSDQPVAGLSRHNSAHRIANYSMADNSLGNNSIFSNHSLVASHSRIVTITSTVNDANDTAMQSTDKFDANSNAQTASGLDSPVLEGGSNFSVGQRQLLCLARALLKQGSRFLLMDEATANIDAKHDRRVQDVVQNHFKAYTIITIAHRLHTVAAYDRVLVMDHGRLVEQGSPRELVQNPQSLFHAMVARAGRSRKDEAANAQRESATNLATPEHTRCGEENEALQGARAAAGSNQEAVRRFLSMCK